LENLRQGAPSWKPQDGPALVLGAGGAARAVIVALQDAGVPKIFLANRTMDRTLKLIADIPGPQPVQWQDRSQALANANLVVNTTLLGQTGQPTLEIDLSALPKSALVTDIVYAPLETDLLRQAKERGNLTVDGLGMLLWQAVPGFEAWFGQRPEVTPELRAFVLGTS
jgi:shikimate dehydrogenase